MFYGKFYLLKEKFLRGALNNGPADRPNAKSIRNSVFILGVDAAWTTHNPSGVALLALPEHDKPHLLSCHRSYEEFCAKMAPPNTMWQKSARGTPPPVAELLRACESLIGALPNVIALDIPLSYRRITRRRTCDNTVTAAYVARGAGTHSPSAHRPGQISKMLFEQISAAGYVHKTNDGKPILKTARYFIESYPHPAIIELLQLPKRLAYKTSRVARYWPELSPQARRFALANNLNKLREALAREIEGVQAHIPSARTLLKLEKLSLLKGIEDALDAIVCAWVGAQFWRGEVNVYGDKTAAIWVPKPRMNRC